MAKSGKSVEDLRRELEEKETRLRDMLMARLAELDAQLIALESTSVQRPRRGRPAAAPAATPRAKAARGGGDKPLVEYIELVLRKNPEGMRARDVMTAVKKAGYRTHAKDFYGIVASTLRDENRFDRIKRGVYKVKGK